jgi:hypothetical protein
MEPSTPGAWDTLKAKLLRLVQTGAVGSVVLASTTVNTAGGLPAAGPRPSVGERVEQLRRQPPAGPAVEDGGDGSAEDQLAWRNWHNWHNWHNGWHNGWHNWHNWHNWW